MFPQIDAISLGTVPEVILMSKRMAYWNRYEVLIYSVIIFNGSRFSLWGLKDIAIKALLMIQGEVGGKSWSSINAQPDIKTSC